MGRGHTLWEEGTRPGREMVALGAAVALSITALELWRAERITWVFDLAFVALCVTVALLVRPRDFFTVGVLPPLVMLGVFTLVALTSPAALAHPEDGAVQAVISGLARHAVALGVGYGLTLSILAVRRRFAYANLPGSPAPTRITSGAPSE